MAHRQLIGSSPERDRRNVIRDPSAATRMSRGRPKENRRVRACWRGKVVTSLVSVVTASTLRDDQIMNVSTNDLKNGMALSLPDGLYTVVEFQHVKPGKGGAFVRTKLKNVRTGAVIDRTYRADEKLEQAMIDKREMQYLYREGVHRVFMDNVDYDQIHVEEGPLGDAASYLVEGNSVVLQIHDDNVVGVDLPAAVELTVTETEPGVQGDRVSGARKPATLETGIVVQVPLFVGPGERIKVDTRTGEYLTRVG
jgi:elongation factor P